MNYNRRNNIRILGLEEDERETTPLQPKKLSMYRS